VTLTNVTLTNVTLTKMIPTMRMMLGVDDLTPASIAHSRPQAQDQARGDRSRLSDVPAGVVEISRWRLEPHQS
jgi:hypothetical protein